jgi:hypothetical protein
MVDRRGYGSKALREAAEDAADVAAYDREKADPDGSVLLSEEASKALMDRLRVAR